MKSTLNENGDHWTERFGVLHQLLNYLVTKLSRQSDAGWIALEYSHLDAPTMLKSIGNCLRLQRINWRIRTMIIRIHDILQEPR